MGTSLTSLIEGCTDRSQLPEIMNQVGLLGEAIEVGVAEGGHSEWIRKIWKGQKLHLVDIWAKQPDEVYHDSSNAENSVQELMLQECLKKMSVFPESSYEIHRATSLDAATWFPPGYFDLIYIDANHNYHAIKADLEAWKDKVHPGGIYAGHDYVPPNKTWGVKPAVDEFCTRYGLQLHVIPSPPGGHPSWVILP